MKATELLATAALFTPAEMEKLLHAAPLHLVPFLAIGALAGIRSVEISRLDWSAVDLERRIITISAGVAKTRSRRVIPIPDNLAARLEPFPNKGRVIPSGEIVDLMELHHLDRIVHRADQRPVGAPQDNRLLVVGIEAGTVFPQRGRHPWEEFFEEGLDRRQRFRRYQEGVANEALAQFLARRWGARVRIIRKIAEGANGNIRAAMGDLGVWMG